MRRIYVHQLPVRMWHWINAVGCVLLVLTGIQIRYVDKIDVVQGDTDLATGFGSVGSRSLLVGGPAVGLGGDRGSEGGRHAVAVRGHVAHLPRGQPQLDGQRQQERGREGQGDGGNLHGRQV